MLAFQNSFATEATLAGYFSADPHILASLAELAHENRSITVKLNESNNLSADDAGKLIEINKIVRRLYDQTASRFLESFDEAHKPMMGWEWYLSQDN